MPFILPAEARRYLPGVTGEDSILEDLAESVDADAARFLGFPVTSSGVHTLEASTYVVYLDGPLPRDAPRGGSRVLGLPVRPVSAVSEVAQSTEWDWTGSAVVSSDEWALVGDVGEVWLRPSSSKSWLHGARVVRVTFTGGWSSDPDARDAGLVDALAFWAAHRFKLRHRAGRAKASGKGGSADFRREDMPDRVKRTLRRFRAPGAFL